ncbi:MAG: hypothetical protein EU517_00325 [Promethearchaeota archaeon]|nr:MAG: hypothetical protein EU517_00325 [Candidatus Lokiarchaeota archaeon]
MTELSEKDFLVKLYQVAYKLSGISKTQSYRFKKEWDDYLKEFDPNPHLIRPYSVEKDKFLSNVDYRIKVLDTIRLSFEDGFNSIKSLLSTLYKHYLDSSKLSEEFAETDRIQLKYYIAKEILGNLFQYNQLDHETVPLKYIILARNYMYLKIKSEGMTDKDIKNSLKKINIDLSLTDLRKHLKEIMEDGFLTETKVGKDLSYSLTKEIELSDESKKKFNRLLRPLVDWPTLFWRSYYNIREINVSIKEGGKNPELLNKILSKAATQGYLACHYVLENLKKYYEATK